MADICFSKLIFISNSVPKSGSTLLFQYQNAIFEAAGFTMNTEATLDRLGIPHTGKFVNLNGNPEVFDTLNDEEFDAGPLLIKSHFRVSEKVRDIILNNQNVHLSMIIRDPRDILLSAMDNFTTTGEFAQFRELDSGIDVVNGHFLNMLESVRSLNKVLKGTGRHVPIVRYGALLSNPVGTALTSLPLKLRTAICAEVIRGVISDEAVQKKAAHRKQSGEKVRSLDNLSSGDQATIRNGLSETRRLFGYE